MSTPYWRLPTARLEFAWSARALAQAAGALAGLMLAFCWLRLALRVAAESLALLQILLQLWPALAGCLLLSIAVGRYRRQTAGKSLRFDGRRWFGAGGEPTTIQLAYAGERLIAARVDSGGQRHRLLLLRAHVERESWRRIRLGLLAGAAAPDASQSPPGGVKIVSPASESSAG